MITTIIILTLIGSIALVLEVFLPGGVLGVIGGIIFLVALGLTLGLSHNIGLRLLGCLGIVVCGCGSFVLSMKFFHKTSIGKQLTLDSAITGSAGSGSLDGLVGQTGPALTGLSPNGRALLGGRKIDVLSEVGAIEKDTTIRVTKTEAGIVYVRPT